MSLVGTGGSVVRNPETISARPPAWPKPLRRGEGPAVAPFVLLRTAAHSGRTDAEAVALERDPPKFFVFFACPALSGVNFVVNLPSSWRLVPSPSPRPQRSVALRAGFGYRDR